MLNRKYTEALQRLAKARTRLAAAEEKMYPALLEEIAPVTRPIKRENSQANAEGTPPKLPEKQSPKTK